MPEYTPPHTKAHGFYFGIPLRAKACSQNWALVCRNLEMTLSSLAGQSRRDFKVLVACHEQPDIDTFDLDIEFIIADSPVPPLLDDKGEPSNDKPLKKRLLGMALKAQVTQPFYYMQLDADDLIHPELVAKTLSDDNRCGYLIDKGFMLDCDSGRFGICDPEHSPFWQQCGSCAVVCFTPEDLPVKLMDNQCYFTQFKRHREYAEIAAQHGRPLTPFNDYMGVYMVNHGENDVSAYRGKIDVKSNYVRRHLLEDEAMVQRLRALYPPLDALIARLASKV